MRKNIDFIRIKTGKYNIPKEFGPNVQYGNELKTMCSILNTEGIVAIDRLTDFVSNITHDKLSVSHGSAINFVKSLVVKSKDTIEKMKEKILNSELMNTIIKYATHLRSMPESTIQTTKKAATTLTTT